jgi:hypothetical protein
VNTLILNRRNLLKLLSLLPFLRKLFEPVPEVVQPMQGIDPNKPPKIIYASGNWTDKRLTAEEQMRLYLPELYRRKRK